MPVARKRPALAILGESLERPNNDDPNDYYYDDKDEHETNNKARCCFCRQSLAAVAVRTTEPIQPRSRTTTTVTRPYCLLHYYTTPVARVPTKQVMILDVAVHEEQYPAAQKLFAEAFVQLQQELTQAMARSTTTTTTAAQKKDPLAVLHHIHKKAQRRKAPPPAQQQAPVTRRTSSEEGGFLREVATPERLVRTQQAQARKQAALLKRMEQAAAKAESDAHRPTPDVSKRRKSSRKSIWNVVMDNNNNNTDNNNQSSEQQKESMPVTTAAAIYAASDMHTGAVCSACHSERVKTLSSHTARDARKGEIWGGRDETSSRVQCLDCGKMWNEEE